MEMDKTKLILLIIVSALISGHAYGQVYSWRRYTMDGHRSSDVTSLSMTAIREAALIAECQKKLAPLREVLGNCPEPMPKYHPESPHSNWLADLMLEESARLGGGVPCDVSLTNFGGIRVDMPVGDVMVDDIRGMLPFTNYIVIAEISGEKLWELFNEMARTRFQVLGGVKIEAGREGVRSVEIGGQPLDKSRTYRMITNSFLLDGGDGISIGKMAVRYDVLEEDFFQLTVEHLRRCREEGRPITGKADGRIKIDYSAPEKSKAKTPRRKLPLVPAPEPAKDYTLTILHTNDLHSHIEPIRGGRFDGLGGVVERAALVDSIRRAEGARNVLLLDAGDYDQGTSYFSTLGGKAEVEALNIMKYDVATVGNHEWDRGREDFYSRLRKARYKTVLCNYTTDDRGFSKSIKPYTIVRRGGRKIGIIGVLTDIEGVVTKECTEGLTYIRPDGPVNEIAAMLKEKKNCDLIIVLSHLGYAEGEENIGDVELAPLLKNVDIIIGGHSHTDLHEPSYVNDADGKPVMIVTDMCWGVYVGEIKL